MFSVVWGGATGRRWGRDSSGDGFVARFAGLALEKDRGFLLLPPLTHVFFKRAHTPDTYHRKLSVLSNVSHLLGNCFSLQPKIERVQE